MIKDPNYDATTCERPDQKAESYAFQPPTKKEEIQGGP